MTLLELHEVRAEYEERLRQAEYHRRVRRAAAQRRQDTVPFRMVLGNALVGVGRWLKAPRPAVHAGPQTGIPAQ